MKYEYLDEVEEKLRERRKRKLRHKVSGKSVFTLKKVISSRSNSKLKNQKSK